ncbi:unnamed protein product [Brassica oleracea var. botrytis]
MLLVLLGDSSSRSAYNRCVIDISVVDVKCILGDPELHSDLVEDVDCEFGRVVDLVKRGYRLRRQDWFNESVDIAVAEAEVDENNSVPGIDASDQEKIEFLTKKVVSLEEKVKYLEGLLNIRGETMKKSKETEAATKTKVNGQNADYKLDETKVLQNYIDAKRQEIAKGKKNGVRPPREVDHQEEDDTEVEHGAKESDTSKEQLQEEEEQEVDVDDGDKESENSETNEGMKKGVTPPREVQQQVEDDAEVDGMKKGVTREVQQQVEDDAEVDVGAKEIENPETNEGMKKGATPPCEVQQQVEDDAEVDVGAKEIENPETNEDGEVNEDASKKPVKGTKKRGRGTKVNISLRIMVYKMFFLIIISDLQKPLLSSKIAKLFLWNEERCNTPT